MTGQIKNGTRLEADFKDDKRKSGVVRKTAGAVKYGDRKGDDRILISILFAGLCALGLIVCLSGCVTVGRYKWDVKGAESLGYVRGLDDALKIFDEGEVQAKRDADKRCQDDDGMGKIADEAKRETDFDLRSFEADLDKTLAASRAQLNAALDKLLRPHVKDAGREMPKERQ